MLIAGAGDGDPSSVGGVFTFAVSGSPSDDAWWGVGSANMLFAGAGANAAPALGGALTFDVSASPSWAYWNPGSAPCWWKCWR